jgi:hypothetical protein
MTTVHGTKRVNVITEGGHSRLPGHYPLPECGRILSQRVWAHLYRCG